MYEDAGVAIEALMPSAENLPELVQAEMKHTADKERKRKREAFLIGLVEAGEVPLDEQQLALKEQRKRLQDVDKRIGQERAAVERHEGAKHSVSGMFSRDRLYGLKAFICKDVRLDLYSGLDRLGMEDIQESDLVVSRNPEQYKRKLHGFWLAVLRGLPLLSECAAQGNIEATFLKFRPALRLKRQVWFSESFSHKYQQFVDFVRKCAVAHADSKWEFCDCKD